MWRRPLALVVSVTLFVGCGSADAPSAVPSIASPGIPLQPIGTTAGVLHAPADLAADEQRAWLARLDRTSSTVLGSDLGPLDDGWDGRIVVELPSTQRDYLALAGSGGDGAAASTRCDAGGSRIAINPLVRAESSSYLDALLLHEAIHAATASACTDARLWMEEGLAEWLTEQHDPATQQANQQWVAQELTAEFPSGLPADTAFRGTAAQVSGAYALAAFAVDTAIERLGQTRAMAYLALPDEPTTRRLTQWYLAGLRARLVPPPASANAQR